MPLDTQELLSNTRGESRYVNLNLKVKQNNDENKCAKGGKRWVQVVSAGATKVCTGVRNRVPACGELV